MGSGQQSPPFLKATCVVCGIPVYAATLAGVLKAAQGHCKKSKVAVPQIKPVFTPTQRFDVTKAPYRWVFNRSIASQNKSTYAHWRVHSKDKHDWLDRVQLAMLPWAGTLLVQSTWHILRIYKSSSRRFDYANCVGGAKGLIDAIRDIGVIRDDADKYFTCTYAQEPGDTDQTVVTLVSWVPLN